jgi:hypothetical protein
MNIRSPGKDPVINPIMFPSLGCVDAMILVIREIVSFLHFDTPSQKCVNIGLHNWVPVKKYFQYKL